MTGLLVALSVASVVVTVLAIPRGSATERAAEAAGIQIEIVAAFESAGVAPEDLELSSFEELCYLLLPDPWRGTRSSIRLNTYAAVEAADVIAALGVKTRYGGTRVYVKGATAEHVVAFSITGIRSVAVASHTGCHAE